MTSIACQPVNSLDELPLAELIAASLPKMDAGTFDWDAVPPETAEEKTAYLGIRVAAIMASPDPFCLALSLDGEVVISVIGTRAGKDFVAALSLARPDANGSRSYIYDQDVRRALYGCLEANGFRRMIGFMPRNSSLKENLDKRNNRRPHHYSPSPISPSLDVYVHWDADAAPTDRNWA